MHGKGELELNIMNRLAPFSQPTKKGQKRMLNQMLDRSQEVERMLNLDMLDRKLCRLLTLANEKPHISYWGEVYYLLHNVRKQGREARKSIVLYDLPAGKMTYSHLKNCFVAVLPDMNISLQVHELTDALLMGRFVPSAAKQTTFIQGGVDKQA